MKWKIKDTTIQNRIVLAPMADICDNTFRDIIKDMGCGLISNEMISDRSLIYENNRSLEMMETNDKQRPISQQIFGSTPDTLRQATQYLDENMKPDIIDINMGCPVNKVAVRSRAGSYLLKTPDKTAKIIEEVTQSTTTPITVKIRSGWDKQHITAVEVARKVEQAGASAVTVHPRTRTQQYEGKADWNIIKEVKENISIPVIGNGDIKTCYDAEKMIEQTGCDAVMIGRGVLGNPWLIRQCIEYLEENKTPSEVTIDERIEIINKHKDMLLERKNEEIALVKMKKHASYYVKGLPRCAKTKVKIFQTKNMTELIETVENYLKILQ